MDCSNRRSHACSHPDLNASRCRSFVQIGCSSRTPPLTSLFATEVQWDHPDLNHGRSLSLALCFKSAAHQKALARQFARERIMGPPGFEPSRDLTTFGLVGFKPTALQNHILSRRDSHTPRGARRCCSRNKLWDHPDLNQGHSVPNAEGYQATPWSRNTGLSAAVVKGFVMRRAISE